MIHHELKINKRKRCAVVSNSQPTKGIEDAIKYVYNLELGIYPQ